MASPCIDICRFDEATGWCLGCGMTRKDKKHWKKDKDRRPVIRAALPGRLSVLAAAGQRTGKAAKRKPPRQEPPGQPSGTPAEATDAAAAESGPAPVRPPAAA